MSPVCDYCRNIVTVGLTHKEKNWNSMYVVGKVQKILLVLEKIMFQRGSFAYGICHTIVLRSMRLRGNEAGDEQNI